MKAFVRLSSKGQITLPKAVRDDLGVQQGDWLEISKLEAGRYLIAKRSPLRELAQALAEEADRRSYTEQDLQAAVEQVRQELWHELYACTTLKGQRWPKKKR